MPSSEPELTVLARPEIGLRARRGRELLSVASADISALAGVLEAEGATMTPLFGATEERVLFESARAPGVPAQEMALYYRVHAPGDLAQVAARLTGLAEIEAAYVKPPAEPAVLNDMVAMPQDAPPVTQDFSTRQAYLDVAPGGIDARYAWTRPGGAGTGVRIIDVEGEWRFSHEDLTQNQGGQVGGTAPNNLRWRNHGTAVVGVFGGDRNAFGITGIAPDANTRAISIFGGMGSAGAIRRAADLLGAGDVLLIELHRAGPRFQFAERDDQRGYIAIEWWPDDFAAIRYAIGRGVIVIEAAGNGAENLDDALYDTRPAGFPATWANPFRRVQDSGAILVGAGAPPPGTHGRNHGPDRSRLDFSNFGASIDVQGWGREVTTCGYGDLQGGANEDLWYTDTFSGTSSASPVVVGAVTCMQGALRAAGRTLLTPATARQVLRTTGSAQQDAPGRPATQRIGNRPNLRQAFLHLGVAGTVVKDLKEGSEKLEYKELKERKNELKENLKLELKERQKELIKEQKDKDKEKERKEVQQKEQEKEKDFFEGWRQGWGWPTGASAELGAGESLEARVAGLEQVLAQLAHFIGPELRPDLGASALGHEGDLQALSAELQQRAEEARRVKEEKDVEKLSET